MHTISNLIATNLLFNRSVVVLGQRGSGKEYVSHEALSFLNDNKQGSLNYIHIDCKLLKGYMNDDTIINSSARMMEKYQSIIYNNPDRIIFFSSVEHMSLSWMLFCLGQMHKSHKLILVGERLDYMALADRCELVRM